MLSVSTVHYKRHEPNYAQLVTIEISAVGVPYVCLGQFCCVLETYNSDHHHM